MNERYRSCFGAYTPQNMFTPFIPRTKKNIYMSYGPIVEKLCIIGDLVSKETVCCVGLEVRQ